jgi:hypothetical protein
LIYWSQEQLVSFRIRDERFLKTLRASVANSRNTMDFWLAVLEVRHSASVIFKREANTTPAFDSNTYDIPFVALYEIPRNSENEAIQIGCRGISKGRSFPRVLVLAEFDGHFSEEIREARRTGSKVKRKDFR